MLFPALVSQSLYTSVQDFVKQLYSFHFDSDNKNIDFSIQVIIRFAFYYINL